MEETGPSVPPPAFEQVLPDDDALVLAVDHHVSVHVVGQGVDVRWVLVLSLRRDATAEKQTGTVFFHMMFIFFPD